MIVIVGDEGIFFRTFGEYKMNINAVLVIPALLGALLFTACGKKVEETTEAAPAATEMAPAAETAAPAPAPAAAPAEATITGGGYEPTAEERVPGITLDAPAAEAAPAPAPAAE